MAKDNKMQYQHVERFGQGRIKLYKQYKLYTAYSLYGLIGGRIQLLEPFSSYTLQDLNSMSLKTMEDFEISIRYSGL